jgi:hypothetical protein
VLGATFGKVDHFIHVGGESVRLSGQAEKAMLAAGDNKEYLPIDGLPAFKKATIDLLLGANSKAAQEVPTSLLLCSYGLPVSGMPVSALVTGMGAGSRVFGQS